MRVWATLDEVPLLREAKRGTPEPKTGAVVGRLLWLVRSCTEDEVTGVVRVVCEPAHALRGEEVGIVERRVRIARADFRREVMCERGVLEQVIAVHNAMRVMAERER